MDNDQDEQGHPLVSSTTSTTTTSGPHTTTTTTTATTPGQGTTVHQAGPQSTTITSPTITTTTQTPSSQPTTTTTSQPHAPPSIAQRVRSGSIRIKKSPSQQGVAIPLATPAPVPAADDGWQGGRRRSSSEPRPPPQAMFQDDNLRRQLTATPQPLQPLYEDGTQTAFPAAGPPASKRPGVGQKGITRQSSAFHMRRHQNDPNQNMMGHNVVDVLDVIGQQLLGTAPITPANNMHRPRSVRPYNSE
jgi:hypothetical protein